MMKDKIGHWEELQNVMSFRSFFVFTVSLQICHCFSVELLEDSCHACVGHH